MVGPLRAQTVGQRKIAIEVTHVQRTDRGQLMHDHVRLSRTHRLRDLIGIEGVGDYRHSAQLVERRPLRIVTRHAVNLMPGGDQAGHELPADRSGRSRHKHSHH